VYEINSLKKFVISPFFNSNKELVKFFNIIISEYPGFIESNLTKEKVFRQLYPGKKYDDKKLRDLTYHLLKLAEEFMGITFYQKRKFHSPVNDVLYSLGEKNQLQLFNKRVKHQESSLEISGQPKHIYFYNKWRLEGAKTRYRYFFQGRSMDADTLIEEGESLILCTIVNLSYIFYNISVTHHAENTRLGSFMINDFIQNLGLEKIILKAKEVSHKHAGLLELYHCLIMMSLNREEKKYFFRLKEIIMSLPPSLTQEDLFNIFVNLSAYCSANITGGKTDFIREGFEIYKVQLKCGAYSIRYDGSMGTVMFHNILQLGLYLKEFEWIEKFIADYGCRVVSDENRSMQSFGYACLNFERGNFDSVIEYVAAIRPDHFFLKYEIKQLFLRTYYELGKIESLLSLLDSSKHFLRKHQKISDERKVPFGNFLKFTDKLARIKADDKQAGNITECGLLIKEISSEPMVTKKIWLLEKAEELKKSNH
jgi:hypothetical protein